jgi:hypothetical protein
MTRSEVFALVLIFKPTAKGQLPMAGFLSVLISGKYLVLAER